MSKKVKKGSALVVVLMFSLLFIVISGVSALAVVSTLKGNSAEERYQTLYYEAEAGIEKALANADSGDYDVLGNLGTSSFTINDSAMLGEVNVNVTKHINASGGEYLQVVSTSTTTSGQSRTVKAKIKKYIYANDIFRYSICGENVEVNGGGSLNLDPSLINSSNSPANVGAGVVSPGSETNEQFEMPIFDDSKIPHYTGTLEINCTNSSTLINILDSMSSDSSKPVRKVSLAAPSFNVYLINADTVKGSTPAITISNVMILCSGDLGFVLSEPCQMAGSSLIAKSVTIGDQNMHISYRPYDENSPDAPDATHSPLYRIHLEMLMDGYEVSPGNRVEGISYYAPNYSYGGGPGAGGSLSGIISDYE